MEHEFNDDYMKDLSLNVFKEDTNKILINVTFSILKVMPSDIKIRISIFEETQNGMELYGRPLENTVCDFINYDKLFYPSILKKSNFVKHCPITVNNYYLFNYFVPTDNLPPVMKLAHGKVIIEFNRRNVNFCKIVIFGRIEQV